MQFAVLCISLPANVVLWLRADRIQSAKDYAEANAKAWSVSEEFSVAIENRTRPVVLDFNMVSHLNHEHSTGECPELAEWLGEVLAQQRRWLEETSRDLERAASTISGFAEVAGGELDALKRLRRDVSGLSGPAGRGLVIVRELIATLERVLRVSERVRNIKGFEDVGRGVSLMSSELRMLEDLEAALGRAEVNASDSLDGIFRSKSGRANA